MIKEKKNSSSNNIDQVPVEQSFKNYKKCPIKQFYNTYVVPLKIL